ncbi:MAG: LamG domain-containing protein, partial [Candidatus Micrarchaeaceae archaeon]
GVFNPLTFAPKASPGSCQVVRPEGAGTTNFISLAGECNGELPEYAASFNGTGSYIQTTAIQSGAALTHFTVAGWLDPSGSQTQYAAITADTSAGGCINYAIAFMYGGAQVSGGYWTAASDWILTPPVTLTLGVWSYVVLTYNGSTLSLYVNGAAPVTISSSITPCAGGVGLRIGRRWDSPTYFSGLLSNVQIYNTALGANDINALYTEGIGGAPIKIQNLVGWWPLNGNANDYSGNNNNGVPTGVTYTSNWYSGYSAP